MNAYVASTAIKQLRKMQNLSQAELARRIGVSRKTVSKWETAKGLRDISLPQPLSQGCRVLDGLRKILLRKRFPNRKIQHKY